MDSFYIEGIISFLEILVLALIFSSIVMFATEFTKNIFKKINISSWIFVVISLIISAVVCMGLIKTFMDGILSTGEGIWLTFLTWLGSNGMFRFLENNNTFLGKLVKSFSLYYLEEIEKQAGISSGLSDEDDEGVENGQEDSEDEVNYDDDNDTDNDLDETDEGDEDDTDMIDNEYEAGDTDKSEENITNERIGEAKDNIEDIESDIDENIGDDLAYESKAPFEVGTINDEDFVYVCELRRKEAEYPTDTSDMFVNDNENNDSNELYDAEGNDGTQNNIFEGSNIDDIAGNEIIDGAGQEADVIKTPEDKMIELIMNEVSQKSGLNDGHIEPNEEILSQFSVTYDDDIINENAPVQKGDLVFNPTTQAEAMENRDLRYE
ncbi:hypothetical protein [uncultured Anaerofustis sp.]|uniref:hypothetical protein n=1 Tax=uncultured Anaerofustis sp. TaxID=904996 RepID=UPI0025DB23FB|nr:hypothetical protein [uncultured Anaerofustis sp.]